MRSDITKDINNHTNTLCPSNIVAANDCSTINVRHNRFKTLLFATSISILILLILLVGCTTIIEDTENVEKPALASEEKISEELPLESEATESEESAKTEPEEIPVKAAVQPGMCEPSWKCISSKSKAYQEANCAFTKKTECSLGCFNNSCKAGNTCAAGFKCITETWSGYQKEDCDWINKKLCEYGCSDGDCLNATQSNLTESTDSTAEETSSSSSSDEEVSTPSETFSILKYGDKTTIDYHNLSIYLLEAEQVKITLDGKNSNWLKIGESYARNGLNLTIKEIMFQSYQGGTKAISYISK